MTASHRTRPEGSSPSEWSILRHLAIHQAPNLARVTVAQLWREGRLGKVLVADWPHEPLQGGCADRRRAGVGRRGVGPAVMNRVARLNPGREAVEDQPAYFLLQDRNQVPMLLHIFGRAMDRGREVALQRAGDAHQVFF